MLRSQAGIAHEPIVIRLGVVSAEPPAELACMERVQALLDVAG